MSNNVYIRVSGELTKAKVEVVSQDTGEVLADLSKWVGGWSMTQRFGGEVAMLTFEMPIEVANVETLQLSAKPTASQKKPC